MDRIITPARMVALGIVLLSACKSSISQPSVSHGLADFTKYVSIGNSLTAGYADGGLYLDGQLNAYPSINATQLKAAVGGVFTQPLFAPGQENGSG